MESYSKGFVTGRDGVHIKRVQRNVLFRTVSDGKPAPLFWSCKGRREFLLLVELRSLFDAHNERLGNGWTLVNTRDALHQTL